MDDFVYDFVYFIIRKTLLFEQAAIAENDKKNGQIYYEMYRKGQESAKFERNFEVTTYIFIYLFFFFVNLFKIKALNVNFKH